MLVRQKRTAILAKMVALLLAVMAVVDRVSDLAVVAVTLISIFRLMVAAAPVMEVPAEVVGNPAGTRKAMPKTAAHVGTYA